MCTVCGCAEGNLVIEGEHSHQHGHDHGHHHHDHGHHHHGHDHHEHGHHHHAYDHHHHDHAHHDHTHPAPAESKAVHKTVHKYHHQGDVHHHYHFHVSSAQQAHQLMAQLSHRELSDAELAGTELPMFEPEEYDGELHYGQGPAHAHNPGMSQQKMVQVEQDILGANDRLAAVNRQRFAEECLLVLNLVSSPGSGKTTLLTATVDELKEDYSLAVIEGDQQTANDAERIRATGVAAVQVNTGKGCHLDAAMVGRAADQLALDEAGILFIENVGNLVCPAGFDLGEAHKVAILSVTEGEDKPLKYPDMFAAADVMLLNKVDLLPHTDFDVAACIDNARRVNPNIEVIQVSARSGEGMAQWLEWVAKRVPVCA
ncbi:hydrogenase nickel incorporation protein HypB [Ferrimonas marina]|uniref:Hydrogenase maturation factor HypB n=1 Tax=Ferrimonas marina TaxID=299255 RepID=A0A1M5VFU8_9GAMM|nr:hydrogenase nickel incorporation protein HypB [Ferrimonas marina]SHH74071.1 hydrogenase nickel incorporation protein HypB [Ferrimonas marina]